MTTITVTTVDCKAVTICSWPACPDDYAARLSLTLDQAAALQLVKDLIERMDSVGLGKVYEHLRREEW